MRSLTLIKDKIDFNFDKSYKQEIYRKLVHLSSFWIPMMICLAPTGFSLLIFGGLFTADILVEYGNYRKWKWARKTFGHMFFKVLRSSERKRSKFSVSGGAYVLLGAFFCTFLFPKPVAMIAISVMLIADTAAALTGKACGRRKIKKNKSLEGTIAFFISALMVCMAYEPAFHFTYISVFACFAATLAELYEKELRIDDNFSIPLVVGVILTVLG